MTIFLLFQNLVINHKFDVFEALFALSKLELTISHLAKRQVVCQMFLAL